MDKGYHLLVALGYTELARQTRSKKDPATSKDCMEWLLHNHPGRKEETDPEALIMYYVMDAMERDRCYGIRASNRPNYPNV